MHRAEMVHPLLDEAEAGGTRSNRFSAWSKLSSIDAGHAPRAPHAG